MPDPVNVFGPTLSSYSRRQAIEDGVLVDLTKAPDGSGQNLCRDAGFTVHVAITKAAFDETIAAGGNWVDDGQGGEELKLAGCQDFAGRLWDVLWMLRCAIRRSNDTDRVHFQMSVLVDGRADRREVWLWSLCGPGDEGEPVITIMLEGED